MNENEIKNDKIRAMFKRGRHNNSFFFHYQSRLLGITKKTIRGIGNIYHIFKPKIFFDVHNIYQDKASVDMTLEEFKYLTSTCWNEKYNPLTIDTNKDNYTGRYRLGLDSIFVPDSSPF